VVCVEGQMGFCQIVGRADIFISTVHIILEVIEFHKLLARWVPSKTQQNGTQSQIPAVSLETKSHVGSD
jgi:hypothetical protein